MLIKKLRLLLLIIPFLASCTVFTGVEGVKSSNGKIIGGSPSKNIRKDIKRTEKRQKRQYDKEMRKRAKRMGTTKTTKKKVDYSQ